jgi:hypothetical protein
MVIFLCQYLFVKFDSMEKARRELTAAVKIDPDSHKARQLLKIISH